jgi:hypothetical protein
LSDDLTDPTLERLDRVLINNGWENEFPLLASENFLDKCLIITLRLLCTDNKKVRKSKAFCFETSWIKHPDFLLKVKETWFKLVKGRNARIFGLSKLIECRSFLKAGGLV